MFVSKLTETHKINFTLYIYREKQLQFIFLSIIQRDTQIHLFKVYI